MGVMVRGNASCSNLNHTEAREVRYIESTEASTTREGALPFLPNEWFGLLMMGRGSSFFPFEYLYFRRLISAHVDTYYGPGD